jgi:hypothetical protein
MMSFPLEAARKRAGLDERFPNLLAWLDRNPCAPGLSARARDLEDLMLTLNRRSLIAGAMIAPAAFAAPALSFGAAPELPPEILSAERLARLTKARALMRREGLGAILIEAGPSLDYFTGVRWGRSERLTAALIPAVGDAIIVTPFFEKTFGRREPGHYRRDPHLGRA